MTTPEKQGDRPTRVLYIARAPFVSGAERALVSVLRHLDRSQVKPHVVLGCETNLVSIIEKLDIPVTIIPLTKRSPKTVFGWWRSLRRMKKLIRAFKPDVMHANDVPSCQAMSVLGDKLGIARVIHVRWVIDAAAMAWWARAGVESVICISQWIRDEIGDVAGTTLADSHFEIMADAVDWPADHPNEPPTSSESSKNKRITLGFAGQLIESKGLDLVLFAMEDMPADQRPHLLVAGKDTQSGGTYFVDLQTQVESSGLSDNVEWLGFLDDVSELHRRVDAMVCPSRVEPLGLVPLEAARFRIPAIASNIGGLAETIQQNQTGFLCEPTIGGWTEGLREALSSGELITWGEAAHARTKEHYGPATFQERLISLYQSAIDRA